MPTDEEIFDKVRTALVDALSVDEDEVKPEAKLVDDLGAESIDLLDIMFRLEKAFDIKIPRDELFPETLFKDPKYVQEGVVTPTGLAELKVRMPFADLEEFTANPRVENFRNLFTVKVIVDYIKTKTAAKA